MPIAPGVLPPPASTPHSSALLVHRLGRIRPGFSTFVTWERPYHA